MGIQFFTDYGNLMQNYKVPTIPSVSMDSLQKETETKTRENAQEKVSAPVSEEKVVFAEPKKNADLADVSLTFNKQDSFEYIGRDKDVRSLDMEKAISDMKKDQMLQSYQYFVGGSRQIGNDGVVIAKN